MSSIMSRPLSHDIELVRKHFKGEVVYEDPAECALINYNVEIERVFRACLIDASRDLEKFIGGYLIAPPKGFYLPGKLEPVLIPGKKYFMVDPKRKRRIALNSERDILESKGAIQDQGGTTVVGVYENQEANKLLSSTPYVPYACVHILYKLIHERVHNFGRMNAKKRIYGLDSCMQFIDLQKLAPEYFITSEMLASLSNAKIQSLNKLMSGAIEAFKGDLEEWRDTVLGDLNDHLWNFLGSDEWKYHLCRLKNTTVVIEKGEDYRLHQWRLEHEHEYC